MNKKGIYNNNRKPYTNRYGVSLYNREGKQQDVLNVDTTSPKSAVYAALNAMSIYGWEVRVCRDTPENRLRYEDKILIIVSVYFSKGEQVKEVGYLVRWR